MNRRRLRLGLAFAFVLLPLAVRAGDPVSPPPLYTKQQAARGKVLYESTCGRCHQYNLRGRVGDPGERPALASLPDHYLKTIDDNGGRVPPLLGAEWASRWGVRPASDYVARVAEAIKGFPPTGANESTAVDLVAYFLQAMGAPAGAQPLTAQTPLVINSAIRAQPPVATAR